MWTLLACISSPKLVPSSLLAPKKEYAVPPSLLAPPSTDPPDCAATRRFLLTGVRHCSALSRSLATYPLFRCREGLPTNLPDQQFSPARLDYHPVVPGTLESGIVFFAGSNSTCTSRLSTAPRRNAVKTQVWVALSVYVLVAIVKKATRARAKPLQNSANSQCDDFSKKKPRY